MRKWKLKYLDELVKHKDATKLTFIHTPKCAGTYAGDVLERLNIRNKGHTRAINLKQNELTFTIIRDPVSRFESLLNFRFAQDPRIDWPTHLLPAFNNRSLSLNWFVNHMTNEQLVSFKPYMTLAFWTQNVDICLTIDELKPFLEHLGHRFPDDIEPRNISIKRRGSFNEQVKKKLAKLFGYDYQIYNFWSQPDPEDASTEDQATASTTEEEHNKQTDRQ